MEAVGVAVEVLEQAALRLLDTTEPYLQGAFGSQLTGDIRAVLKEPLDVSRWDWSALDPRNAGSFEWKYGVTPFSNWQVIAVAWVMYFSAILFIKLALSRASKGFELKPFVVLHNIVLIVWSLAMFLQVAFDINTVRVTDGVDAFFCTTQRSQAPNTMMYALYVYYLSKFYELLDTVILALKKDTIIFLHWYHHAIVIVMAWSWVHTGLLFAALGMAFNTLIHVFMYYYYCMAALKRRVWFKQLLTSGQIVQFITSFVLAYYAFMEYQTRSDCLGFPAFAFSMFCNGTFLLLFARFYVLRYLGFGGRSSGKGGKGRKQEKQE